MKRALALAALVLVSCYPTYRRADYRPDACPVLDIVWIDTVPDVDPIDAACLEFERRTGTDARPLVSDVTIYLRKHSGDARFCVETPVETCTYVLMPHTYAIEYRDDSGLDGYYLWHEMLHVILFEAGHPGNMHHDIMRERGWL